MKIFSSRFYSWNIFLWFGLGLSLLMGCSGSDTSNSTSDSSAETSADSTSNANNLPENAINPASMSDDQAKDLGSSFASAKNTPPSNFLQNEFDAKKTIELYKKLAAERGVSKDFLRKTEDQLNSSQIQSVWKIQAMQAIPQGVVYYSGIYRTDTRIGGIYRLEKEDGTVDFLIGTFTENSQGLRFIKDVSIATEGGTLNDIVINSVIDASPIGEEKETERADFLKSLNNMLQSDDVDGAINFYENGNGSKYKAFYFDGLYAIALEAKMYNASTPEEAVKWADKLEKLSAEIKKYKPDYVGVDLMMLNERFSFLPPEKGLKVLERLRKMLGDDPYFDYCEGLLYMNSDKKKTAVLFKTAGKKKLRSFNYLLAYYILLKTTPGASQEAAKKLYETGDELYGNKFRMEVQNLMKNSER